MLVFGCLWGRYDLTLVCILDMIFVLFDCVSLTADRPQRAIIIIIIIFLLQRCHCHPACGHQGSSHLSPMLASDFLSRCKFSPLTSRQPIIVFEFYLLLIVILADVLTLCPTGARIKIIKILI